MREIINRTGAFIQKAIPEKQRKSLYAALRRIMGSKKKSRFQLWADRIRIWKPYEFTKVILKLITLVFKSPGIAVLAKKGYAQATVFQEAIDTKKMKPETAGKKLRGVLKADSLTKRFRIPDWLINFLCEGVVLALKLLRNIK